MSDPVAVVLAAGKSTRMKSDLPKVLHEVCGRRMIDYVLDAARASGVKKLIVVVGHRAELVREALAGQADVVFAEQLEQKGTGHAAMMCEPHLRGHQGSVLILAGDTPLLSGVSLKALLDVQEKEFAACVIGSASTQYNEGLGRIVRDLNGQFQRIVEQKDATPEERAITEINTGCYVFRTPELLASLTKIRPNNAQSEYYLTDCPGILMTEGFRVSASCSLTIEEAMGVNTRVQLAEVQRSIQAVILRDLMLSGVTVECPDQTVIQHGVQVGRDSVIRPFSLIERGARIGNGCTIGPWAWVRKEQAIPDGAVIAGHRDV
ncbi:MAG: NTP transferase domain-containing protein [Planctomyces sp.]